MELSIEQREIVGHKETLFVVGAAGTGKSSAVQSRIESLLQDGEPAYTILVLVAEHSHRENYLDFIHESGVGALADLQITTYSGLARDMVTMFWPLVARPAGFKHAYTPPTWLSYDLAQMLMWEVVTPMLDDGHFADLRLRPQQIVSQLLDNLNRSALNGLTVTAAIQRQIETWAGEPEHIRHLYDAKKAALAFRKICYENNLIDLSLAVDVFQRHLIGGEAFSRYFSERFRHLLVDNVEEQTAMGQSFVMQLMDATVSTTIVYDAGGGYKRFLAADPTLAEQFRARCQQTIHLERRFLEEQGVYHVARHVQHYLLGGKPTADLQAVDQALWGAVQGRYRREMLVRLGERLRQLVEEEGVAPHEIAIIVPYLDGALRYKLTQSLAQAGLTYQLSRRRASPREEPRVRAWLVWLALAFPSWDFHPSVYDMAEALTLTIHGLDPARAMLLAKSLYDPVVPALREIGELTDEQTGRVGQDLLDKVVILRDWLLDQGEVGQREGERPLTLDFFIHRLFTDLLSQRQFIPEPDVQAAAVCDWLVRLATRLRQAAGAMQLKSDLAVGRVFVNAIQNGLVTAHPPDLGDPPDPNGVYIGTIYSFLLSEKSVPVQVWLETGATGWWDIPRQPLSNAFVLAQGWDAEARWTLDDDARIRNEMLTRVIQGLCARCQRGVLLATSELDRRGVRQDGPLWRALQENRS